MSLLESLKRAAANNTTHWKLKCNLYCSTAQENHIALGHTDKLSDAFEGAIKWLQKRDAKDPEIETFAIEASWPHGAMDMVWDWSAKDIGIEPKMINLEMDEARQATNTDVRVKMLQSLGASSDYLTMYWPTAPFPVTKQAKVRHVLHPQTCEWMDNYPEQPCIPPSYQCRTHKNLKTTGATTITTTQVVHAFFVEWPQKWCPNMLIRQGRTEETLYGLVICVAIERNEFLPPNTNGAKDNKSSVGPIASASALATAATASATTATATSANHLPNCQDTKDCKKEPAKNKSMIWSFAEYQCSRLDMKVMFQLLNIAEERAFKNCYISAVPQKKRLCVICQEDEQDQDQSCENVVFTCCGSRACASCAKKAVSYKNTCPFCRSSNFEICAYWSPI